MSTNTFTDEEVEIILCTIKSKPHYVTASEKDKLTIQVEIARKLTSKLETGRRSALQVRYKLVQLQKGYQKLKEKPSLQSTVNKQAVKYFKLLDEIFGENLPKKKKTIKNETPKIEEKETNAAVSFNEYIIKEEEGVQGNESAAKSKYGIQKSREGVFKSNDENSKVRQVTEFADYSFKVPQTTDSNSSVSRDVEPEIEEVAEKSTIDTDESPELRRVLRSFTSELQASQRLLVEAIKEQDKKYVRSFKDHCKCQAAVLKRDRYEIKSILKKDRNEMLKVFKSVLNAMGKSMSYQVEADDNDEDNDSLEDSRRIENARSGRLGKEAD